MLRGRPRASAPAKAGTPCRSRHLPSVASATSCAGRSFNRHLHRRGIGPGLPVRRGDQDPDDGPGRAPLCRCVLAEPGHRLCQLSPRRPALRQRAILRRSLHGRARLRQAGRSDLPSRHANARLGGPLLPPSRNRGTSRPIRSDQRRLRGSPPVAARRCSRCIARGRVKLVRLRKKRWWSMVTKSRISS